TVTDPTGAVVPSATITLKELQTGDTRTVQSNSTGIYRFTYVKPGTYQISASSAGLKSDRMSNLVVAVGQVQTLNLVLKPLEAKEIVMVTDAAPLLQVDNANLASSFSSKQVDLLPAPGGDITTVAFTVPGVVVSTGAGYGNFSSHGLPGISNLFTINGVDNMDPYLKPEQFRREQSDVRRQRSSGSHRRSEPVFGSVRPASGRAGEFHHEIRNERVARRPIVQLQRVHDERE